MEWQPIETAPRDRTTFDVWVAEDDGSGDGYRVTDLYFSGRGLLMRGGAPVELSKWPSFWMPLPASPVQP